MAKIFFRSCHGVCTSGARSPKDRFTTSTQVNKPGCKNGLGLECTEVSKTSNPLRRKAEGKSGLATDKSRKCKCVASGSTITQCCPHSSKTPQCRYPGFRNRCHQKSVWPEKTTSALPGIPGTFDLAENDPFLFHFRS